jgi:hypothetical protein
VARCSAHHCDKPLGVHSFGTSLITAMAREPGPFLILPSAARSLLCRRTVSLVMSPPSAISC